MTGACFGAGLDIISAADIRYCSADAYFCVKEVDLAIAADMGVLQRLPGIVGEGGRFSYPSSPSATSPVHLRNAWLLVLAKGQLLTPKQRS